MSDGKAGPDISRGANRAEDSERLDGLIDPAVLAHEASPAGVYSLAGNGEDENLPAGNSGGPTAASANPRSDAASSDTLPSETPNPQAVNPLAAAITLLLASPPHRHLFIADLEWRLLPAIASGQFRLITKDNRPLAFVTWAFLSDEIKERLKSAGGNSSGAGRLKPEEWRSGKNHVIVDFVSPFITDEDEKKRMLGSVFGAKKKEAGSSE